MATTPAGGFIHASLTPPPPPWAPPILTRPSRLPIRVGFIVYTFSFGGSETETIELIRGCDPDVIQFAGVAVARPQPLPDGEPARDGSFPPIVVPRGPGVDATDPRLLCVDGLDAAIRFVLDRSDIVLTWGVWNLQEFLPSGRLPKFVIVSKDSGDWAKGFLNPNSLFTSSLVANSTNAAGAFPGWARHKVTVIHDGINPARVAPRQSRAEQRRQWGVDVTGKVVGYLGRIEHDKGVSRIADAMHHLPPSWTAVFVGVSPTSGYAKMFEEYCGQTIPGRYRLLGWSHDIGSTLLGFDVFCHPSEHEGFSNSIAEAWLAGVPTVYTAGTGAIPDVGDLGIPVSPDADGAEIAAAVQRALHADELVSHAKHVIESRFLIGNNIRRWTSYLRELHTTPTRPRVMLLLPSGTAEHAPTWLTACAETGIDPAACCVQREPDTSRPGLAGHASGGCPFFSVHTAGQVASAISYTRPDSILTFQGTSSAQLIPPGLDLPVVVAAPDPRAGTANWVRWVHHLARPRSDHVYH